MRLTVYHSTAGSNAITGWSERVTLAKCQRTASRM